LIKKAQILIAGALAVALIAAGCGGGGSSSTSSSSSGALSKDEFVSKANTVCRDAQAQLTKIQTDIQAKVKSNPSQIQALVADSLAQIVPIVRKTVDQIAALNAPSDLKPKLDEFKTKTDAALDQVAADPAKALRDASSGSSPFTSLQGLASDLGLKDCGGTSSGTTSTGATGG
jgi:ABC-type glycerol-3-phosphate transport system substrate-binding protein